MANALTRSHRVSKASPEGRARALKHGDYLSKAAEHPAECECHLCRRVWCILCPAILRVEWVGLTSFGSHLKACHAKNWHLMRSHNMTVSGKRWNTKWSTKPRVTHYQVSSLHAVAREMRVSREIERASGKGVKALPLDDITDATRLQITEWIGAIKRLPGIRKRLFMEAIEATTDGYNGDLQEYRRHLIVLQTILEETSISGKPAVITKDVCFDPRVAIEIAKLSYALDRSWSFVVHLCALYGLRAITDGLRSEGIAPPSTVATVPRPKTILKADEARALSIERLLRPDDNEEIASYGFPDDETPDDILDRDGESTFIDKDFGGEESDADTQAELYDEDDEE